jgi:nucleoside 2-deoxyribosyltransferase
VFAYYDRTKDLMADFGYDVFIPMYGKGHLRTELEFKSHGYDDSPLTTNHAIFSRDKWMVKQADVLYANFLGATRVSMGSMFELAWGCDQGKQVVVVMEKDNIHRHAFVLEAASVIFEKEEDALLYLERLIKKDFS